MASIDVAGQRRSLLEDATVLQHLPPDLLDIFRNQASSPTFLDNVARAALIPALTERIFAHLENVFPDICARWILHGSQRLAVASAFARVLPFAPCLSTFLTCSAKPATANHESSRLELLLPRIDDNTSSTTDSKDLLETLITVWRLLSFDARTFRQLASPGCLQSLFTTHESRAVRLVAIRVFCQLLNASDAKLEALIAENCGQDAIIAELDGRQVDFGFLSLHEHTQAQDVVALRQQLSRHDHDDLRPLTLSHSLTQYVLSYGQCVLPRPLGPIGGKSNLVATSTTTANLENLASLLREPKPVLLHGPPGVGKTTLIHEFAKQLGMHSTMVTLHLNEQTDAKTLIGLYSTDAKPGSFQWRPGVLTTAVKEGRWVLIEDLDRAPTEVVSTLLPLIERRELLIPTRGETIRAASSFRLFATLRTSSGFDNREYLPSLVGMRFWQSLRVLPPAQSELEQIISQIYPILHKLLPGILAVYGRISQLAGNPSLSSRTRVAMERQLNLRDLLKWCRRLQELLLAAGSTSGSEPISETTRDWMFMEAVDCFVGSCPDSELGNRFVYAIAEEMHVSKDRADHYLSANIPILEENDRVFRIGRAQLRKKKASTRLQKSKRPFASTTHAKKLLEQVAVAVKLQEPVLLVGETGIGKTTVVQQLAESLGHKLIAVNLSQQSEAGDLLGGFKPVNVRSLAVPLKEEFEDLFAATGISATKNQKYLEQVGKSFAKGQWSRLCKLWREAPKMFTKTMGELERMQTTENRNGDDAQPTKRRKIQSKLDTLGELRPRWDLFARNLEQFDVQVSGGPGSFAFSFVEGNLVKAVRNGDWVLLDEINLASPDTLESIADLLNGADERPYILLAETGKLEKIVVHPNFRIFGAMNPATDIGKRDLPIGIRSRFTELYVRSPDADHKDLLTIIKAYLGNTSTKNDQAADDMARLYLNTKRMADERRLVDGANEVPHFSLRTLTRVLSYVNTIAPLYGMRRALFEGFSMGFLTLLDRGSEDMLLPLIYHHLLDKHGNVQDLLSQAPKRPNDGKRYVKFQNRDRDRQYWLFQGEETPVERDDYIVTPYVERNLLNLVRATSTRSFPILIQGPTSAGKTSMIEYLANFTGNKFVRINNHEHTDLQEYLGTYVSGSDGKLRFQEGLLVQAMRQGHWIVLDELNLAPTDVLEALNRLLDDNRELLIPETQEIVRPHENFILFATQNPPGLYGGRKILSRAFRNRFLELHFDDIPEDELEYILQHRSRNTSPSDCRRIVAVYKELSLLRQTSRLFEQKDSFATLRDLFRWALREADTREEIAAHGFMLLAERVRNEDERLAVKGIIERVFKIKIDLDELYSATAAPELKTAIERLSGQSLVWTHAMRRLYVLVSRAIRNNEPVLLVGETGCGKTTVCQLLAEVLNMHLDIVNAHQNTETGDLIGSQRPVRNRGAILATLDNDLASILGILGLAVSDSTEAKLEAFRSIDAATLATLSPELIQRIAANETRAKALFEWSNGALVNAMRDGHLFLLDEISLADDSVLERLNSVLEPQRTLLLAEKGIDNSFVAASDGFQFLATMNPGGDFGKKELSPALRNRFTEIWVPPLSESTDIYEIIRAKLTDECKHLANAMVDFAVWFGNTFRPMATTQFSVRELLAWVDFINCSKSDDAVFALVHGASAVFIDSIGANPSAILVTDLDAVHQQRQECLETLRLLIDRDVSGIYASGLELVMTNDTFSIGKFTIPRLPGSAADAGFAFHAPTTRLNAMRVLRALQMRKPILLEGSPGVGKTSLVAALSLACGRPLTRINLSDQTDLMDLFGTDVPVEGEEAGNFAWRDAPFLQAMQKGEWVLLDEMNLASQSVLEGLNACLDHRGEVYIAELDQTFQRHPDFRLFAAQNPHHQGGGRKGLPASFVNRFIVVYADVFQDEDLKLIASHNFPDLGPGTISLLINFVSEIDRQLTTAKSFGSQGGPWEFNLRDILRWLDLLNSSDPLLKAARVDDFLDIIVRQRFRTQRDRDEVTRLFARLAGHEPQSHSLYHDMNSSFCQVGLALLRRNSDCQRERSPRIDVVARLSELESLMICVERNMPCILSSPSGYGKSALLTYVAASAGKQLVVFPMNADVDTMDLVGGFEQADPLREVNAALCILRDSLQDSIMSAAPAQAPPEALRLLQLVDAYSGDGQGAGAIQSAIESLLALVASDSGIGVTLSEAYRLLQGPLVLANPQFEWLDGVIVKAIQTGQWLVLDNANMCNASVLDRLNSLLEPNGFLCINEHCDAEGRPKMIKPHPDFRIFLTMDPRHGELSRAMRNRAVEIHIPTPPPRMDPCFERISGVESTLLRCALVQESCRSLPREKFSLDAGRAAFEYLSVQDVSLLPRLMNESQTYLARQEFLVGPIKDLLGFLQSPLGSSALQSVMSLYGGLQGVPGLSKAQPINAFNNLLVAKLCPSAGLPEWTGVRLEMSRLVHDLRGSIERHCSGARLTRLASLTRLQRSFICDRVAAVSKDSTVELCMFISTVLRAIEAYSAFEFPSFESWKERCRFVRFLLCYIEETVALSSQDAFDEARFQAHLTLGTNTLQQQSLSFDDPADVELTTQFANQLKSRFKSGFKLSTGLSMEVLWHKLRPSPFLDEAAFTRSMELDQLALRFDVIRWKANASISDLARAHKTLEEACTIVRTKNTPADELVRDLRAAIESLATSIGDEEADLEPYLANEFEHLRQLFMLECKGPERENNLAVLSNVPTRATMMLAASNGSATTLQSVDCLAHQDTHCWDGKLAASVWQKLQGLDHVSLRSLALLETELPILGRHISDLSAEVTTDPLNKLNGILWQLLSQVFVAHDARLECVVRQVRFEALKDASDALRIARDGLSGSDAVLHGILEVIEVPHLQEISRDHLIPSIVGLIAAENNTPQKAYLSALAWIQFSVGIIKLYVPDRIFDPQLRLQVELDFFNNMRTQLRDKISALKFLEKSFSGQDSSVRIEALEYELSEIAPSSSDEIQPVYRPAKSELHKLHAECTNVIKAVTGSGLSSLMKLIGSSSPSGEARDVAELVRFNVQTLIARFASQFAAYQDMTAPIGNILRCLSVGLSLCDAAKAATLQPSTMDLVQATPFVGSGRTPIALAKCSGSGRKTFEYLALVSLMVSVEGSDSLSKDMRESVFQAFHSFFDDWSLKIEADRKAEAEKTSLYHFRGGAEDEEEFDEQEFNELFPTHDDDGDGDRPVARKTFEQDRVRDMALRVAAAHRTIFLERLDPQAALHGACLAVGQQVVDETRSHPTLDRSINGKLLPVTTLVVNEKLDKLASTSVNSKSYNFYTDANLPEARQLVSLALKIKARFRELQRVDEIGHMQPLADVVQSCRELLDKVHAEPLAKLLPKVEQLHGLVYEWQFGGWASKIYAVLPLHNALTDTIIRWRRLELSTWARLFDMEEKKCQDDAYSWWFVAYQVVVATPLSMVGDKPGLCAYAKSLIESLEKYFSNSIIGQFKTRVALLRQLSCHLHLLTKDHPSLEVICHSIDNFISFYAWFLGAADSAVQAGRAPIERKIKDVLLMASWKDTNINALRESARKSHQKLFRLVRKFRAVLGREMKSIIEQGLPEEKPAPAKANLSGISKGDVAPSDPVPLNAALPGWLDNHRRLAKAGLTASLLNDITQKLSSTSSAARTLDDFVSDLGANINELRKETPGVLSDETKETVKHLKTRKRKLLADTLKDLRGMGLSYNLSQDRLAEQALLAVVLASSIPISATYLSRLSEADYFFHKTLDLAPRARATLSEHSEDLTGAEIGRCVGFVEGMISFALLQRRKLAHATSSYSSLRAVADDFRRLGDFQGLGLLVRRERDTDWLRLFPWLSQILRFAAQLAEVHGRLGKTNLGAVSKELLSWAACIDTHLVRAGDLGDLPARLDSEAQARLAATAAKDVHGLREAIKNLIRSWPSFAHVLSQVLIWTQIECQELNHQDPTCGVREFADAVSTMVDTILVAVEGASKAAGSDRPQTDEAGWLKTHNEMTFATMHQIRMNQIQQRVSGCIELLQEIDLSRPGVSAAAMSIISLAAPVLDQFLVLCLQSVEQSLDLHRATVNMACHLTSSFIQIASSGFCTPQEKSDEKSGESDKLESGTGFGNGEGAEDISKDVQLDEDIAELAQEGNKGEKDEIEDEKDAVDMADEELEGEMGSVGGEEDEKEDKDGKDEEENDGDEMDEEVGDVDGLDPTAVYEKMWDGGDDDKAEKDQQGNKPAGQEQDDEQVAAEETKGKEEEKKEEEKSKKETNEANAEDQAAEKEEEEEQEETEDGTAREEINRQDQNVEENDALELPDEMDLDLNDEVSASSDDDDLDAMSDVEGEQQDVEQGEDIPKEEADDEAAAQQLQEEAGEEAGEESEHEDGQIAEPDETKEDADVDEDEEMEDKGEEPLEAPADEARDAPPDQAKTNNENVAPSDVKSSGLDQNADSMEDEPFKADAAQQADGAAGEGAADQEADDGTVGTKVQENGTAQRNEDEENVDTSRKDPFRKLGDALEKWHRQQSDIQDADADADKKRKEGETGEAAEQEIREFQHLENDDAAADTQAMGMARDEEVQPVDESMAIEDDTEDMRPRTIMEGMNDDEEELADAADEEDAAETKKAEDERTGVKTRQGNYNRSPSPAAEDGERDHAAEEAESDEEELDSASAQLDSTHISEPQQGTRDLADCARAWSELQSKSHRLSLSLTSQLRLILTPSQSVKLSGAFRTGKRLNIKRIIPYIASSFKRDKIWMRRSVPTKRRYQVLLCVDDSASMGGTSAGRLAMESLVMVSRSLTMLEVGQVGVVGFGSEVFVAHELTEPFGAEAGARVLQRFGFRQRETDFGNLLRRTIDMFRDARRQQQSGGGGGGGAGAELWQLALVLSDGLTPSAAHDATRRLLREAVEERIMVVFIVMDDTNSGDGAGGGGGKRAGVSVLDLKEAKFVRGADGECRVVVERYLDTFPFQYYLIVHEMEELPSALAGLLRTWFAEVAG